jgi:trehalose-6-phosphate synthase
LTRLAEVSVEVVLLAVRTDNIKTTKEKSKTMMNLTKEEIVAIADRLDEIVGTHSHAAAVVTIFERKGHEELEVTDEDILAIKEQLKRIL